MGDLKLLIGEKQHVSVICFVNTSIINHSVLLNLHHSSFSPTQPPSLIIQSYSTSIIHHSVLLNLHHSSFSPTQPPSFIIQSYSTSIIHHLALLNHHHSSFIIQPYSTQNLS